MRKLPATMNAINLEGLATDPKALALPSLRQPGRVAYERNKEATEANI